MNLRATLQNALRLFLPCPQCSLGHKKNLLVAAEFSIFCRNALKFSSAKFEWKESCSQGEFTFKNCPRYQRASDPQCCVPLYAEQICHLFKVTAKSWVCIRYRIAVDIFLRILCVCVCVCVLLILFHVM